MPERGRPKEPPKPKEFIHTAYAANFSGPGWANSPVIVVLQEIGGGETRLHYIQPEDQTDRMRWLHAVAAAVHIQLSREASAVLGINFPG